MELAALSTGGRRGPRGWHSVTFIPQPPSAAPHSNNRDRRFSGWLKGKRVGRRVGWMAAAERAEEDGGEAGRKRVSFVRPKHTSIDWACPRVEEVFPSLLVLPWPLPSSPMVLCSFVLLPLPRLALESAQREWCTCTCVCDSTRAYMWHGEGLLWRPTLGTGVKRHWPARGLDRPPHPLCMRECVHACECIHVRARLLFLATVHVDLLVPPATAFREKTRSF